MTINLQKSKIFFFNTPLSTQMNVTHILGFKVAKLPSKYLGAPLTYSALKHSSWKDLLANPRFSPFALEPPIPQPS